MPRPPVIFFALILCPWIAPLLRAADDPDAATLAATELAFARRCGEVGVRASFLEFFATDGLIFVPGPTNAHQFFLGQPAPAQKPPYTLNWWPELVRVARSGDFGFSTGPTHRTRDAGVSSGPEPHDGYYFSVWKKQSDGKWRVALDLGAECPLGSAAQQGPATLGRVVGADTDRGTPAEIASLQAEIAHAVTTKGVSGPLARFTPAIRVNLDEAPVATGHEAAAKALEKFTAATRYEPTGAELALSGDMAVTYGRAIYEKAGEKTTARWSVQVWEREAKSGAWQLAIAIVDSVFAPAP